MAKIANRIAELLLVSILLGACTAAPTPEAGDEWRAWERESRRERVPAELFPGAVEVRVYAAKLHLSVGSDGKVTATDVDDGVVKESATALDGGPLTPDEISTLRRSVFYSPPPPAVTACCIPRHAFLFYGAGGRYLGLLMVGCGCAAIAPGAPPSANLRKIVWEPDAIERILAAHGVPYDMAY